MARTAVPSTLARGDGIALGSVVSTITDWRGTIDATLHKPSAASRPAVVLVHGGGWISGDRTEAAYVAVARWLADAGFCVFNTDYTLVPGNNYPSGSPNTTLRQTLIDDVLAAVAHVRTNAATYNADSSRVAILGTSAGGHLGLMAGITGVRGTTRPDAVVAWSPPTRLATLPTGSPTGGLELAENYLGAAVADAAAAHSPYSQITRACPPIRIVGSTAEDTDNGGIPRAQYDDLHTAAQAAGVDSTKAVYTGTRHADFRGIDSGATLAWLRSALKWAPASSRVAAVRTAASGRIAA